MTIKLLASWIAKLEGKKSQAKIGDIREILRILVEIEAMLIAKDERGISEEIHQKALALLRKKRK